MNQTIPFTSWGKGELSPSAMGRIDTTHYYASAKDLTNCIVRPYGNVVRRPGTIFAKDLNTSGDCRLIEFVFSTSESYIIVAGEYYFRIFDSAGVELTYNLATVKEWIDVSAATAWSGSSVSYVLNDKRQHNSAGYICIHAHTSSAGTEPGTGATWTTEWELLNADDDYEDGDVVKVTAGADIKYYVCTANHTTVTADTKPGAGTLASTLWYTMTWAEDSTSAAWPVKVTHPYTAAQIWDLDYAQKNDVIKFTHQSHDIAELRRYNNNVFLFMQGVITGAPWEEFNSDPSIKMNASDAAVGSRTVTCNQNYFTASMVNRYMMIGSFNSDGEQGYGKITAYSTAKSVTVDVLVKLSTAAATTRFALNAFYTNNYPAHVTFHEARTVLGGTPSDPAKTWYSKSFVYNDFNIGDTDDDGFSLTCNTAQANKLEWIASASALGIGSFGAEFVVKSPSDKALNATNKNAQEQSAWGSEFVKPCKIGDRLYYLQRTGRKLREFFYNFDQDNYTSSDMTQFSDHITLSGVVDMAYQRNQDSLLWCVLANGKMAVMARCPETELIAWTPWETNGTVESIRFLPNPAGTADRGFIIVERYINTAYVKYLEYFDTHVLEDTMDTYEDITWVDCSARYSAYTNTIGNNLFVSFNLTTLIATLTASSSFFYSLYVGLRIRIQIADTLAMELVIKTYTSDKIVVCDITYVPFWFSIGFTSPLSVTGGDWAVERGSAPNFTHLKDCPVIGLTGSSDATGGYVGKTTGGLATTLIWFNIVAGLAYGSYLQTNPLNASTPSGVARGKIRRIAEIDVEVYRSLDMEYSSDGVTWYPLVNPEEEDAGEPFTGTIPNVVFDGKCDYTGYIYIRQITALPMNILGIYARCSIAEGK